MSLAVPQVRLDVHAHMIPLTQAQVDGVAGLQWSPAGHAVVDGAPLKKRELYQPAMLLEWMDKHGVAEAWVSVPPTLYREQLDEQAAYAWATLLNAALVTLTAGHESLRPMLHLPVYHAGAALRAADEAIARGHRLFAMPAGDARRGRMLSDPSYAPLWASLDKACAFLMLHPAGACDSRLSRFSLPNLLGGPTETAIAAAHLSMSGMLEQHPRITICLAHGGGSFAAVAGRLQRGQDTDRDGTYMGGEKARTAMKRFCVDCITHDADALALAAAAFGPGRVLFGSDWPFDMGLTEPHTQLQGVAPALREAIMSTNPEALIRHMGMAQEATA
jgi:aminocarboxymuconate-semialdehyde decarboxylase